MQTVLSHLQCCTFSILLDDSKKFSILKRGIGIKSEKVSKQVLEIKKVWKKVKDKAQGLLYIE